MLLGEGRAEAVLGAGLTGPVVMSPRMSPGTRDMTPVSLRMTGPVVVSPRTVCPPGVRRSCRANGQARDPERVSSNRALSDVSLDLAWRKPFDYLAERPFSKDGRGDWIRTSDLVDPNHAL